MTRRSLQSRSEELNSSNGTRRYPTQSRNATDTPMSLIQRPLCRYLIQDEDYEMYDKIDKQVAEELRKEKGRRDAGKIAERKAKEEGVAHIDDTEKEVSPSHTELHHTLGGGLSSLSPSLSSPAT
jgi:hypothetical protein